MRGRRPVTLLAYGLAGAVVGMGAAFSIVIFGAGVFWLWIFGDDLWPAAAENALVAVAFAVGLACFGGALVLGWRQSRARGGAATR